MVRVSSALLFALPILAGGVLFSPASQAAGFNCAKASTAVEKAICADPELSRLDDQLTANYKKAMAGTPDGGALTFDQHAWLKSVRNRCTDSECLVTVYQERINVLGEWNLGGGGEDITGNFRVDRPNFIFNPDKQKNESITSSDCLSVKWGRKSGIDFSFELIGGNGHMCSLSGHAERQGGVWRYQPDPKTTDEVERACRFELKPRRHTLLLSDPDGACRQYACGARAGIDGLEFVRARKSAKQCGQ